MKYLRLILIGLWLSIAFSGVIAQEDEELPVVPYFQSDAFNVPILETWEDQSTDNHAQFYHPEEQVTIRTAFVNGNDSIAGAKADLEAFLGTTLDDPVYSDSVNLADGTWAVLVYQVDTATTASAMAKRDEGRIYVVSFIETNPDAEIVMATIEHTEDSPEDDPSVEIATLVNLFTNSTRNAPENMETAELPSGEWHIQSYGDDIIAMGFIFGNDSYLALANGANDALPELANAYNTTLLGFFITPDNSGYLVLGLAFVLGVLFILAFSIVWRSRSLEKDLAVIQQLANDESDS